ncbi:MAG TPA: hypothetical protein PKL15_00800 [Saprospiraceae bacterium]|nr:hypothetical protein [Saprospiraceae bacterium]HNM23926.1 hypothetical protein [Saprospiraceae bacterium]
METKPDNNLPSKEVLEQLLAGVTALEGALAESEQRAQKYAQEAESLRKAHQQQTLALEKVGETARRLQQDYETLRIQKGGFGFKMLLFSGFAGFVTGFLLHWLFFRPHNEQAEHFARFRDANLFNYEVAISQGRIDEVEKALKADETKPENADIRTEIEFARKLVGAAARND